MPRRPRILITTSTMPPRPGSLLRLDVLGGLNYAEAVIKAGGAPLMLPNVTAEVTDDLIAVADGLLLAGGGDFDPELFGQTPHPNLGRVDPVRDALELALYRGARARGVPVLGICRGLQAINVAEGGSLHQHLPDVDGALQHMQRDNAGAPHHAIRFDVDSRLAAAYGSERIRSNSYHHQAIDRLGDGLRAVGWSDDGLVEAIEADGGAPVVAVQWHPEMSFERYPDQFAPFALFHTLVSDRLAVRA